MSEPFPKELVRLEWKARVGYSGERVVTHLVWRERGRGGGGEREKEKERDRERGIYRERGREGEGERGERKDKVTWEREEG